MRLAGDGWYLAPWAGTLRARPHVCAATAAFLAGEANKAVRRFDDATALAPRNPEIRVSLTVALWAAEQLASTPHFPRRLRESIRSTRAGLTAGR